MPADFYQLLSTAIGWTYTLLWSASFFPQPLLNCRRRTTAGTNINFPAINILGFVALSVSHAAFLYSPIIRAQYQLRHDGELPTVRFNDLAFALCGVLSSIIIVSQFWPRLWGFKLEESRPRHERHLSWIVTGIIGGSITALIVVVMIVGFSTKHDGPEDGARDSWAWIDVIYTCSYIKIIVTLVKYAPQVYTNYSNKSTQGWSILQIMFDFMGGVLSLTQLFMDSAAQHDWSGVTGNPVKLGLGQISIIYDTVFFVQHYYLYRGRRLERRKLDVAQGEALLDAEGQPAR